ncbi:hypothetical protein V6N11_078931 [Hibiscus sabdariffa]|uniref:Disease resistance protein RGA3 n=1 Tax=Hibiscus sabdariffa TaxID=183260 RepID=A0ABR2RUE6_9ROSI
MAEQVAFDIAKGLLSELSSPVLEQLGLWWNFKDDLKSTISAIKVVVLDAEEQSVTSNLIQDWLAKLKDALYDAEDLLDDVRTEALREKLMTGNKLTKEVRVFFSRSNRFAYGLKMGRRIKAIKAGFTSIQSQISMLNLVQRDHPLQTSFAARRRRQTHSFASKGEIIGRDDDKTTLLELLLDTEFESEENVVIVPIVGIGGLGKTALAQLVYNHEKVKDHFELRMWVCVSDVFDVKIIVENIIKSLTNKSPDQYLEMDQLQKQLRDKIEGKKYLLVLDDIWNEEREQWFSLMKLLMGGARGSRIVVTTRSRRVAKITGKCQPYELRGLSEDDAWSLFKEIAFEQRYVDSTNSTFVKIGKQILEKCGGVPLVIRTIAGTLSIKETENEWLSFKDNVLSRISQNEVAGRESSILDSNSTCEVDEKCRHVSIDFSLIPLLKGKKLRTLLHFPNKRFQNMSDATWNSIISNCRCLRALELDRFNLKAVPDSIHKLKHLRYLDLSENDNLKILPKSICKTQNLQVLKLDRCYQLEELPKKIDKLVNLTHLGCRDCWGLTHMSRGIGKLTSLETLSMFAVDKDGLHGGGAADLSELCGLNNLRGRLQITNLGSVKNAKEEFRAANLKGKQHLQTLDLLWSGIIPKADDDKSDDEEKSLEDLQPHPNLKALQVGGWRGDAKFPSWFALLTNLTAIEIRGPSKFKHLPSFAQLPHLKHLAISKLTELEYMDDNCPIRGHGEPEPFFPSLTDLILIKCPNMKCWWKRPVDDDKDTTVIGASTIAFPRLSYLKIDDCPLTSMPLYPSVEEELMLVNTSSRPLKQTIQMNTTPSTSSLPLSKLKSFHVENIEELDPNMLQECLQNMNSLKEWGIGSCHWLKSLSGWLQQMKGLTTLTITDCKELDLEGMQWEPLKNLSHLIIDNLPQLVSLPLWLRHLVQLKRLQIKDCSGLRSLFPVFQHLTFLQSLHIKNCKELELSADGIQIFQDDEMSLRFLQLQNIPKCLQLPEWLQHLANLKYLVLLNLPNLTLLPDEMRSLTTLEELRINDVPQLEERCEKDIGADWHKIAHIPYIWVNKVWCFLFFESFINIPNFTTIYCVIYFQAVNMADLVLSSETGAITTEGHLIN